MNVPTCCRVRSCWLSFTRIVVQRLQWWLRRGARSRTSCAQRYPGRWPLTLVLALPAGLHGRAALHYFAPLGNLYLNEIYHAGSNKDIQLDFGAAGNVYLRQPELLQPDVLSVLRLDHPSRSGVLSITVDLQRGREDWRRVRAQAAAA